MSRHVYNAATAIGWAMLSAGAGLQSLSLGLIVGGTSLLVLTLASAMLARRN